MSFNVFYKVERILDKKSVMLSELLYLCAYVCIMEFRLGRNHEIC